MSEAKIISLEDTVKSERLSPLGTLEKLITKEVPRAIGSPTTKLQVDFHTMLGSKRKNAPILQDYYLATVQMPFADLNALSPEEFNQLKIHLRKIISTSLRDQGQNIPADIADAIDPNNPKNILEHETDHFKPLCKYHNQGAYVNISFIKNPGKENTVTSIDGSADIDEMESVSLYDRAISLSNPKSLNETDIQQALDAAMETKDKEFIKKIKGRVKARLKH